MNRCRRVRINHWVHWQLERVTNRWPRIGSLWLVYDWTAAVTCRIWDHEPERDQHDFCIWCGKPTPVLGRDK